MRKQHSWLEQEYAAHTKSKEEPESEPLHESHQSAPGWNWNDVFGMAREAANRAREFTHAMADTEAAVDMAEGTHMQVYQNDSSLSWHIDTIFTAQDIDVLRDMNPLQLRTFVDSLTERYREWLGELFYDD
jgi:hypothetical protein